MFSEMMLFNECQNTSNDFWGYIHKSSLEWACVSSRELSDGSIRQRMEAIDNERGYKCEFIASFYNGKCEIMYNWNALYID